MREDGVASERRLYAGTVGGQVRWDGVPQCAEAEHDEDVAPIR